MMKTMRPTRGFWDWVGTGQWDGGDGGAGSNG